MSQFPSNRSGLHFSCFLLLEPRSPSPPSPTPAPDGLRPGGFPSWVPPTRPAPGEIEGASFHYPLAETFQTFEQVRQLASIFFKSLLGSLLVVTQVVTFIRSMCVLLPLSVSPSNPLRLRKYLSTFHFSPPPNISVSSITFFFPPLVCHFLYLSHVFHLSVLKVWR